MPKLKNAVTGVTVNVDDDTAANLDANVWVAEKEPAKRKTSADKK